MSICLAQDTFTPESLLFLTPALTVALMTAAWIGVFHGKAVLGPRQIHPERPIWPALVSGLTGAAVWLGTQLAFGIYLGVRHAQGHVEQPFDMALDLSTTDYLFLAIVPGSAGFVVLLVLDLVIDSHVVQMIGARLAGLSIGLVKALAGMLIVFPLMIWASLGLELFYRKVGFQHPNAHQLLTVMKETHDPLLRGSLVFGACFVAPLFEEFLFRGHIQTVFVRFLLPSKRITPDATSTSEGRTAKRVWVAIFLTSVLFAVVHPAWTIPLILLLSLCLGYAYERTGNLWVSVFLHALFNTSSTVYFLWFT